MNYEDQVKRLKRPNRADFRVTDDEYEYICRKGRDSGGASFNEGVLAILLPYDWKEELKRLRKLQRKMKLPDSIFYPSRKLNQLGIQFKTGRRRFVPTAA